MPPKPKRPCGQVGCSRLTTERFCDDHKKQDATRYEKSRNRESAHKRGYTARWAKASKLFLLSNPLCAACSKSGRITPATCTDHIKPHKKDPVLFWDQDNWQPLCKSCHDKKTARENGWLKYGSAKPKWLEPPACDVVIVWGAPGSGKSTYVSENKGLSDVVIDLDVIMSEISGLQLYQASDKFLSPALYERNRMLGELKNKTTGTAWLILTGMKVLDRVWWLEKLQPKRSIVLYTPLNVCIDRIKKDDRRGDKARIHIAVAEEWHLNFLQLRGDTIIVD